MDSISVSVIAKAVVVVLDIMRWAIFIVILMSWIPQAKDSKFASALRILTDPILVPVRQLTNKIMGEKYSMMDFSPIFALLIIYFIQEVVGSFITK